jgi:hypothetical protein
MITRFFVPSSTLDSFPLRLADLLGALLTIEVLELGTEDAPVVEPRVALYAEEHLFGTSRVEVVLHHEVQKLPATLPDLIDELRERDATGDQTLACVAWI